MQRFIKVVIVLAACMPRRNASVAECGAARQGSAPHPLLHPLPCASSPSSLCGVGCHAYRCQVGGFIFVVLSPSPLSAAVILGVVFHTDGLVFMLNPGASARCKFSHLGQRNVVVRKMLFIPTLFYVRPSVPSSFCPLNHGVR